MNPAISKRTLLRLPLYLNYLKSMPSRPETISAAVIAKNLGLNHVQVRKDLAAVGPGGRPRIGYVLDELIWDIEQFLGYKDISNAVVVGAGKLGTALLIYEGFREYGLNIVAAFDSDESKFCDDRTRRVLPVNRLGEIAGQQDVRIGIITVPQEEAQKAADLLVACGVGAIWNFAPVHLNVPEGVLVHNENMAASLALLSKHLIKMIAPGAGGADCRRAVKL